MRKIFIPIPVIDEKIVKSNTNFLARDKRWRNGLSYYSYSRLIGWNLSLGLFCDQSGINSSCWGLVDIIANCRAVIAPLITNISTLNLGLAFHWLILVWLTLVWLTLTWLATCVSQTISRKLTFLHIFSWFFSLWWPLALKTVNINFTGL